MNAQEYLKQSNDLCNLETERIVNGLERKGFKVTNKMETRLFLGMIIESVGNKSSQIHLIHKAMGVPMRELEEMVVTSIHVACRILFALNGHTISELTMKDMGQVRLYMDWETYIGEEILDVASNIADLDMTKE